MLINIGFDKEFKNIIQNVISAYGYEMLDIDGIGEQLDMANFGKRFFTADTIATSDISVDSNANVDDITVVAYENEMPKPYMRLNSLYLLWKECKKLYGLDFANRIVKGQISGDYYINDLSSVQKPYCYNFSAYDLMIKGLPFVKKIDSKPPKHLSSFCGQLIHFTSYASNQVAGAVGIADLLIVISYYVKKEFEDNPSVDKDYIRKQVKQELQSLIFSMNQPFRGGLQSGFYNISIYDREFLNSLVGDYLFPDGSNPDIELVLELQDLFVDLMNETLRVTTPTFPIIALCLCKDENNEIKDKEFLRKMCEKNIEFGFMNVYSGSTGTLSSCCRLRSDKNNKYLGYTNSFGGASTQIGSFGVVTLNLPRIALESKGDLNEFTNRLKELTITAIRINDAKRIILQKRIDLNALPLYAHNFMDIQKQYATVGVNGINEAIKILGKNILDEDGQEVCSLILNTINELNAKADDKYGYAHNLEQTPKY